MHSSNNISDTSLYNTKTFLESRVPLNPTKTGPHFLNLITVSTNKCSGIKTDNETSRKTNVFACISINELRDINPANETYQIFLRVYLVWQPALRGHCDESAAAALEWFSALATKAQTLFSDTVGDTKYVSLTEAEREDFAARIKIPDITFPSAISCEPLDNPAIRIYADNKILWNQNYTIVHSHTFDLRRFPYDCHKLPLKITQNNSATWNLFDITVAQVQFKRDALTISEWTLKHPVVQKQNHKNTTIYLKVRRESTFYSQNVVLVMLALSMLGFTVFAFGEETLPDRVNTILTLLLTAVAFKMAIGDALPKLGYNTLLDRFFLINMGSMFGSVVLCTIWGLFDAFLSSSLESMTDGWVTLNRLCCAISFLFFFLVNTIWWCSVRSKHVLEGEDKETKPAGANFILEKGATWYSLIYCAGLNFIDYSSLKLSLQATPVKVTPHSS